MPTYNYFCKVHKEFEAQQSIKDPALEACPKCVNEKLVEHHCKACDTSWPLEDRKLTFNETVDLFDNNIEPSGLWDSTICINCNSSEVETCHPKPKRLISLGNFILKGGGWASEGYK